MRSPEDRFREIFSRNYRPVVAYVRRRTNLRADAEDIVADVFAVAWRRLDAMPADHAAQTLWLYGVARRTLANHRRSASRMARLASRLSQERFESPAADAETEVDGDVDDALRAMSLLSESDQELLRLALWEQLSHAQIATVMGMSVANVAVRLHRAKRRLRTKFISAEQGVADAGHRHLVRAMGCPDPESKQ